MRSAVKEQIESLGAKFVELDLEFEDAEAEGGYARQLTDEEQQQPARRAGRATSRRSTSVITTARSRGSRAPLLVTGRP